MAALRVATGATSANLAEARHRAVDFFRAVCRELPILMDRYNLDEVITIDKLRSKIAAEFRRHGSVTNPKIVDMLVFKGEEEFRNYILMAKQRHHVITQWVVGKEGSVGTTGAAGSRVGSEFLHKFFESNNF